MTALPSATVAETMASKVTDAMELPVEGSSYFGYLCSMPVGARMSTNLSADAPGALSENEELVLFFVVKKVKEGERQWLAWRQIFASVRSDSCTLRVFEHVQGVLAEDDEDVIMDTHGRDPLVELDSDSEEEGAAAAGSSSGGRQRYQSVKLCLKTPVHSLLLVAWRTAASQPLLRLHPPLRPCPRLSPSQPARRAS